MNIVEIAVAKEEVFELEKIDDLGIDKEVEEEMKKEKEKLKEKQKEKQKKKQKSKEKVTEKENEDVEDEDEDEDNEKKELVEPKKIEEIKNVREMEREKIMKEPGPCKGIHLIAEKAHNKNITRILGLELFGFNIADLTSLFQVKYACSVSFHEIPGKIIPLDKELIVHGNFLQEIIDYLTMECKVDKQFIHMQNKLDKKKKNN